MQFNLRKTTMTTRAASSAATIALTMLLVTTGATPTKASGGGNAGPLSAVPSPLPDLSVTTGLGYVKDQAALTALGKALFWDMQTGNDGKQACASCHFHAGADHRITNQINPHGEVGL